jgi:hypothetical protein
MANVAMEYSPRAAIPYVGRVDAGTIELVRGCGPEVVSSADLVQYFEARWTPEQKALHDRAAKGCHAATHAAFALIKERLLAGRAGHRERGAGADRATLRRARPRHRPSVHRRSQRARLGPALRDRRRRRRPAASSGATWS